MAIVFSSLQERSVKALHGKRGWAALATLIVIIVSVLLPLALLSVSVTNEASAFYQRFKSGDIQLAEYFQRMVGAGDFFEHALVHGDWKGTAKQSVEPQLAAGHDVLLEIDWQGALQVRRQLPEAVSVFILPPSKEALEHRMRARAQDSEETIQRRLAAAREEMSHYDEFDYVIVNEHFADAVAEMCAIFVASRLRRPMQQARHEALIAALLNVTG